MTKFPAWMGRYSYYVLIIPIRLYSAVRSKPRVRVLCVQDGRVLLVRSWFGKQLWSLPGGGIKHAESPVDASARELSEETGLLGDDFQRLGVIPRGNGTDFDAIIYDVGSVSGELSGLSSREIIEVAWHPIERLPEACSPLIACALRLALKSKQ